MKLKCLRSLLLTEPEDDLANIRRTKGKRVKGTCKWVLVNQQYAEWVAADRSQLLRLTGSPGIGKTMIATFLVDELKERAKRTGSTLFAFFFFDDKNENRRTATALLRALLVQLLRQQPTFFKYVQPEYDKYGKEKFEDIFCKNFDALWRVFEAILSNPVKPSIFILIDALDECEEASKVHLARAFNQFFQQESERNRDKLDHPVQSVKFVIIHRPERKIEKELADGSKSLCVDGGLVNSDLSEFIREKTDKLQHDLDLNPETTKQIRDALEKKHEGTFLWVALVLEDMDKREIQANIMDLLNQLPSNLPDTYERILQKIKPEYKKISSLVLRTVFIARRPLTVKELATVCFLESVKNSQMTVQVVDQDVEEWKDSYRCCGAFLKLDETAQTIHLVHQSAKDFLRENLSEHKDLASFYPEPSKSNLLLLQICWNYLSLDEFEAGNRIVERRSDNTLKRLDLRTHFQRYYFLEYACQEWEEHAIAAYPAWIAPDSMERRILDKMPALRDLWLLRAAGEGQEATVRELLDKGAGIDSRDDMFGQTPLSQAASSGHEAVVQLLLNKDGVNPDSKDDIGQTPLSQAASSGHKAVVQLLQSRGTLSL